jgi:hypothetical protein
MSQIGTALIDSLVFKANFWKMLNIKSAVIVIVIAL